MQHAAALAPTNIKMVIPPSGNTVPKFAAGFCLAATKKSTGFHNMAVLDFVREPVLNAVSIFVHRVRMRSQDEY